MLTASHRLLYGFFVIEPGRRHIVHFNATFHPTAAWVIQQLRDAFSCDPAPRYIIFDRDSIFSAAVVRFIKSMGTKPVRTSFRSPGRMEPQNAGSETAGASPSRASWSSPSAIGPACEVVHQLLPQGSLPIGTRKRHAGRETDHAATVTHGQGLGVAESGWPSPSLRVAGSCVAQFSVTSDWWPQPSTMALTSSNARHTCVVPHENPPPSPPCLAPDPLLMSPLPHEATSPRSSWRIRSATPRAGFESSYPYFKGSVNPNRKISKHENAKQLGAGEKLVLGHPSPPL